ncbi:MAG: type II toxin-antitoxin system PemK/MazF family toxin, partial [Gammaproteobacteria bacterium]
VIISPDEMNRHIGTAIVAPMTTHGREYPSRVPVLFQRKRGQIVLDQIRTVDKQRLVKHLGKLNAPTASRVLTVLSELFAR